MTASRQLRIGLDSDGNLQLFIPSPASVGGGHNVSIPATVDGLRLLRETLQAQSLLSDRRLGSAASPTQSDIQALVAAFKPTVRAAKPEPTLDFEIDLSGLEL